MECDENIFKAAIQQVMEQHPLEDVEGSSEFAQPVHME